MTGAGDLFWWPAFCSEPAGVVISVNRACWATCLLVSALGAPRVSVVWLRPGAPSERNRIFDAESAHVSRDAVQ